MEKNRRNKEKIKRSDGVKKKKWRKNFQESRTYENAISNVTWKLNEDIELETTKRNGKEKNSRSNIFIKKRRS